MSETTAPRSPAAERQAQHRRGVAHRLERIEASVEALTDALAVLIAERQTTPRQQEHPECRG